MQFCRGRPQQKEAEGSPVHSAMQRGYSGQTPKRRRGGSPLGSEQMSEFDWFTALSLSGASVTALANQKTGNANVPWLISGANSNRPRVALIRPKNGWCRANASVEMAKEGYSDAK